MGENPLPHGNKNKMENKNEEGIMKAIGTAVAVVILAVIAALVVGSILGSSVFDDLPVTGTITNETLVNVTNLTISSYSISTKPGADCALDSAYNSTSGQLLSAGNYTDDGCTIILTSASSYIGEDINVTYAFTYDSGTSLAGVNVTNISQNFGEFITGLLGFLGIIGIVLGVIWLILYVARLFSKGGLNDLGATA